LSLRGAGLSEPLFLSNREVRVLLAGGFYTAFEARNAPRCPFPQGIDSTVRRFILQQLQIGILIMHEFLQEGAIEIRAGKRAQPVDYGFVLRRHFGRKLYVVLGRDSGECFVPSRVIIDQPLANIPHLFALAFPDGQLPHLGFQKSMLNEAVRKPDIDAPVRNYSYARRRKRCRTDPFGCPTRVIAGSVVARGTSVVLIDIRPVRGALPNILINRSGAAAERRELVARIVRLLREGCPVPPHEPRPKRDLDTDDLSHTVKKVSNSATGSKGVAAFAHDLAGLLS